MAKLKTRYVCQACGGVSSRWQGQCPECAEWNSLVQEAAVASIFSAKHGGRQAWKAFHDQFLSYGGPPIPLVRKAMMNEPTAKAVF